MCTFVIVCFLLFLSCILWVENLGIGIFVVMLFSIMQLLSSSAGLGKLLVIGVACRHNITRSALFQFHQ